MKSLSRVAAAVSSAVLSIVVSVGCSSLQDSPYEPAEREAGPTATSVVAALTPATGLAFREAAAAHGLSLTTSKDGGIIFADLNGDECPEVLVNTTQRGTRLFECRRRCEGTTDAAGACVTYADVSAARAPGFVARNLERSVVVGDVNNDGLPDVARSASERVEIYFQRRDGAGYRFGLANGSPDFEIFSNSNKQTPDGKYLNAEGLAWVDIDRDGWLDLVVDNHSGGTMVLKNPADGSARFVRLEPAALGAPASGATDGDYLSASDFDGDGDVDVVNRKNGTVDILVADGAGKFTGLSTFDVSAPNEDKGAAVFCDFDDDGRMDLFWSHGGRDLLQQGGGSNRIYRSLPDGRFVATSEPAAMPQTARVDDAVCGDVDLDGDLDLFLSADGADYLFLNQSTPGQIRLVPSTLLPSGDGNGEGATMGDFDGDGDLDILVAEQGANRLLVNDLQGGASIRVRLLRRLPGAAGECKTRVDLGATVRLVRADGTPLSGLREMNGGRGHGSQDTAEVLFAKPLGADISDIFVEAAFLPIGGVRSVRRIPIPPALWNKRGSLFEVVNEPCVRECTPVSDGNACTVDACDPDTGLTSHTAVPVDDGNACTLDFCDPATGLVTNAPRAVDDGNACTVDACDPATGLVTNTPVVVDDGNACTIDACDPATGVVTNTALVVDDGNPCTVDICDPVSGLRNDPLPDGTPVPGATGSCATGLQGPCGVGAPQCIGGAPVCVGAVQPQDEICDGIDNNCNGEIDEGVTRTCSTACGTGTQACVPIAADVCNSAIIVSGDEWPLSNAGFAANPDGRTYISNVARCFAGSKPRARFLARSSNFGVTDSGLRQLMSDEGHDYVVDPNAPWTLETLSSYDGVFLAGAGVPDTDVLVRYVQQGGHVYIAAGTGQGTAAGEAAAWNPFLSTYGLALEPVYAGARAIQTQSTHPLFRGVRSVYQDNENPIRLLPNAPEGAKIVETYPGQTDRGYFAVFDDPSRRWSACSARQPSLEVCDGVDNDCNGIVDDGPGGAPLTRACSNACGNTGVQICGSVCTEPTVNANNFTVAGTYEMGPPPGGTGTLGTLQAAYYDRVRDEVAVFSFWSGEGRVLDRSGQVLRTVQAPLGGSLDGAVYDVATGRALFVNQSCVLVEADTATMEVLARHDDLAGLHRMSTCAGLAVGRDENLYFASYGTNEVVVISRDTRTLVRRIALGPINFSGVDGIAIVPGTGNFLLVSSTGDNYMTITPTGQVVTPPTSNGNAPLSGGYLPGGWDGIVSICSTGHIWVCEEYGTRCVDYAPVDGDQNTCGCLSAQDTADVRWSACNAAVCCAPGQTACDGACVDVTRDPTNCGACGVGCATGEACESGVCRVPCGSTQTRCDGVCVDTGEDSANCGACGIACGATEVCRSGVCSPVCGAGETLCGGLCVNLSTSIANCGACGTACGATEVCTGGICTTSCGVNETLCNGTCVNPATDAANCGSCGRACGQGQTCVAGSCTTACGPSETLCGSACANLATDAANCGACGRACTAGQVCEAGACVTPALCDPGLSTCSGACVDTRSSAQHCGGCNDVCPVGQLCQGASCVLAQCDGPGNVSIPVARLTGPARDAVVGTPVDVTGTASDVDLVAWYLEVAPAGSDAFTLIRSGTSSITEGTLGKLDPTLLENGPVTLRLRVVDCLGQVAIDERPVAITGDNKVGLYRVSFRDLEVPLAGIPITVTRTYDSRTRGRQGDFGMGWTLDVGIQGRVGRNVAPGDGWSFRRNFFNPCVDSDATNNQYVEVRLSEQDVYTFRPRVVNLALYNGAAICIGTMIFEQVGGKPGASLVPVVQSSLVVQSGTTVVAEDDFMNTNTPFDPEAFQLVTREGWRYQIDRKKGVQAVWDPFGQSLTVGTNGILHSAGVGIAFRRNGAGLIEEIVDPTGRSLRYAYEGRELASVVDRARNPATRFFYEPGHYLTRIVDPTGKTPVRVEYDSDGRMRRLFDASGNPELVEYDPVLNVGTFTSRGGAATRTEYDERGRLVEMQVGNYFPVRYEYDDQNRIVRESRVHPLTGVPYSSRRWEYNSAGDQTLYVDDAGLETRTTYTYDAENRPTRKTVRVGDRPAMVTEIDERGRVTRQGDGPTAVAFTYDGSGRMESVRAANASAATVFGYDSRGNIVTQTTGTRVDRFTYDANNWLRTTTVAGKLTEFDYDANGRKTRTTIDGVVAESTEYDARGNVLARTDGTARYAYAYDDATRVLRTEVTVPRAGGTFLRTVTTETRDPDGRTSATEARAYVVSALGAILEDLGPTEAPERVEFDEAQAVERRFEADGSFRETRFDGLGRVVARVDEEGRVDGVTLDVAGRVVESRSGRREYDAEGRVVREEDALGRQKVYSYDAVGRLLRVERRDASGVTGGADVYEYGPAGELLQVTDAAGRIVRYGVNGSRALGATGPFDTVTPGTDKAPGGRTDEAGYGFRYAYDESTRTLSRTLLGSSLAEQFVQDAEGRVVQHRRFNGDVVTYGYDELGNRTSIALAATASAPARTYTLRYTAFGALSEVVDSARGTTRYAYDARQRLVEITYPSSASYPQGSFVRFAYDRSGKLVERTTPAGTTRYGYDERGWLTTVTDVRLGSRPYVYGRDATGFVRRVELPDGSVIERTPNRVGELESIVYRSASGQVLASFTYTRDAGGRITRALENVGGQTNDSQFDIDDRGRLVRETRNGVVTEYGYDDAGNRLTVRRNGETEAYAYDAVGRLRSAGGRTFEYNENGALVRDVRPGAAARSFGYDALERLVAYSEGNLAASYDYDHEGIRFGVNVSDGVAAAARELLVDPTRAHAEVLEESSGRSYVFGEERVAVHAGGSATFLQRDARDIRFAQAAGANAVSGTDYDAFGASAGGVARLSPFGFTGEAHDSESGLVYLRARYYDPTIGRFISRDSYASQPAYVYAGNDPVNFTDPTGHFQMTDQTVATIGFGHLAAMQAPVAIPSTLQMVIALNIAAQSPVVVPAAIGAITFPMSIYLIANSMNELFFPQAVHKARSPEELIRKAIEKVQAEYRRNNQRLYSVTAVHTTLANCEGAAIGKLEGVVAGVNASSARALSIPALQKVRLSERIGSLAPRLIDEIQEPADQCLSVYRTFWGNEDNTFNETKFGCSERDALNRLYETCGGDNGNGMAALCQIDALETQGATCVKRNPFRLNVDYKPNCCACCFFWAHMKWNIKYGDATNPWSVLKGCSIMDVIEKQLSQPHCKGVDDFIENNGVNGRGPAR
jgi:RHS repeat-associated protein